MGMIIMSVDYGDTRTGIAVCDHLELLASPVCVIEEKNTTKLIEKVTKLAYEKKAECLVVGFPKNMDSSEGPRAAKSIDFASKLEKYSGIKVNLWDERLTTVSAINALNVTNTRGKKRKAIIDAVAATMILQDYLSYRRMNNG